MITPAPLPGTDNQGDPNYNLPGTEAPLPKQDLTPQVGDPNADAKATLNNSTVQANDPFAEGVAAAEKDADTDPFAAGVMAAKQDEQDHPETPMVGGKQTATEIASQPWYTRLGNTFAEANPRFMGQMKTAGSYFQDLGTFNNDPATQQFWDKQWKNGTPGYAMQAFFGAAASVDAGIRTAQMLYNEGIKFAMSESERIGGETGLGMMSTVLGQPMYDYRNGQPQDPRDDGGLLAQPGVGGINVLMGGVNPHAPKPRPLGEVAAAGGTKTITDLDRAAATMQSKLPTITTDPQALARVRIRDNIAPYPQPKNYEAVVPKPVEGKQYTPLPKDSPYAAHGSAEHLEEHIKDLRASGNVAEAEKADGWLKTFLKDESGSLNIFGKFVKAEDTPVGDTTVRPDGDIVRVHADHTEHFLSADKAVKDHETAVAWGASEVGKQVLGDGFNNKMTGQELYKAMADKIGPADASKSLAKYGVEGFKTTAGHYIFDDRIVEPLNVDGQGMPPTEPIPGKVPPQQEAKPAARTATDNKGNILLDRIKSPDEALQVMHKADVENNGFQPERAGRMAMDKVEAIADALGLTKEEVANGPAQFHFNNDSKLRTAFQALQQSAADWWERSKAFVGKNDFESLKAFHEGELRHGYVQGFLTGKLAEAGRTLAVPKEFYNPATGEVAKGGKPLELPKNARETAEKLEKEAADTGKEKVKANADAAKAESAAKEAEAEAKQPAPLDAQGKPKKGWSDAARAKAKASREEAKATRDAAANLEKKHQEAMDAAKQAQADIKDAQPPGSLREFQDTVKTEADMEKWLKKNGKPGDSVERVKQRATDMAKLEKDEVVKAAVKLEKEPPPPPTIGQRVQAGLRSTFFNWILSGPFTHAKYIIANEIMLTFDNLTPIVAGAWGHAREAVGLKSDVNHIKMTEAITRLKSQIEFWSQGQGIRQGFSAAARGIKEDRLLQLPSEIKFDKNGAQIEGAPSNNVLLKEAGSIPVPGVKQVAQGVAYGVTAPLRVIYGIHSFHAIRAYQAELNAWATRAAIKEGFSNPLSGAFWERVNDHVSNPYSNAMKGATDAAEAEARRVTHTTPLGETGKKVAALAATSKIGFLLTPFTHIPANIVKNAMEMTPFLNLIDGTSRANLLGRNGVLAQQNAVARMTIGGAVLYQSVTHALDGSVTGDGPIDPTENARWALDHKRRSVAINGQWWSYDRMGAVSLAFGIGAKTAELGRALQAVYGETDPERADKLYAEATSIGMHTVGQMLDEAGFQNLGEMFDAMQDKEKGQRWIRNQVTDIIPFSSLAGQVAASIDPATRRIDTMYDAVLNRLPGLRQTLEPKLDRLGQPVDNPRFGTGAVLPHVAINRDPVIGEMQRLDVAAAPIPKHFDGILLTPAQQNETQATFAATLKDMLGNVINDPDWRKNPDLVRHEVISEAIKASHEVAKATTQNKYPQQFLNQAMQNKADVMAGTRKRSAFDGLFPEAPQ